MKGELVPLHRCFSSHLHPLCVLIMSVRMIVAAVGLTSNDLTSGVDIVFLQESTQLMFFGSELLSTICLVLTYDTSFNHGPSLKDERRHFSHYFILLLAETLGRRLSDVQAQTGRRQRRRPE